MGNFQNLSSSPWASPFWFVGMGFGVFFIVAIVWSIAWKGMALWKAARKGHKGWFVALLLINTLGILEILYIYVFSKKVKAVKDSS